MFTKYLQGRLAIQVEDINTFNEVLFVIKILDRKGVSLWEFKAPPLKKGMSLTIRRGFGVRVNLKIAKDNPVVNAR